MFIRDRYTILFEFFKDLSFKIPADDESACTLDSLIDKEI